MNWDTGHKIEATRQPQLPRRFVVCLAMLCLTVSAVSAIEVSETTSKSAAMRRPQALTPPQSALPNAHKVMDKLWLGAQPDGVAGLRALKALGIKTIITVDGARPPAEAAKEFGIDYIHLPMSYDCVPDARSKEIAKALIEKDGPVYIHCHHGKHRGPAAAAAACVVGGLLSNDEALQTLKVLGTGENYAGLWDSVRKAKPAGTKALHELKVDYTSAAPIPPLAEAMVRIDDHWTNLSHCCKAGWATPKDHPDLDPPHEALQLREHFFEIARSEAFKDEADAYRKLMRASETDAKALEESLREYKKAKSDELLKKVNAAHATLKQSCTTCHEQYRDKPEE